MLTAKENNKKGCARRLFLKALGVGALACLSGPAAGRAALRELKLGPAFVALNLHAGRFSLRAWLRQGGSDFLHVFIEGDGDITGRDHLPAFDPTPAVSVAASLAKDVPANHSVLYLARPGQYASREELAGLSAKWWTSHRYAEPVVEAISRAIQQMLTRSGCAKMGVYGHSGGGALAVLAAPSLGESLRLLGTVASPLDTHLWTQKYYGGSLAFSLNPLMAAESLRGLPQLHLSGAKDALVPTPVLDSFLARLAPLPDYIERIVVPGAGHQGPWLMPWRKALAGAFSRLGLA